MVESGWWISIAPIDQLTSYHLPPPTLHQMLLHFNVDMRILNA